MRYIKHLGSSYPPNRLSRVRTVHELLGHQDVKTTMIYTHVLQRGAQAVKSPFDRSLESAVIPFPGGHRRQQVKGGDVVKRP